MAACAGRDTEPRTNLPDDPHSVLDALKREDPATDWEGKSLLRADLDLDGTEDYALSGLGKGRFKVGIVHGPVVADSRVWTLEFPMDGGEDALCSRNARMALEPLEENEGPKAAHPRKGKGINLSDGQCDAFHIYWNPEENDFEYWRL